MQSILKSYQRKLTNLTAHNRSLVLLKLSAEQGIDLHSLDYLNNQPSYHIIHDLIAGKKRIELCPVIDSRDHQINTNSSNLKRIYQKDIFVYQERGAQDLYIGWPFVRGKLSDNTIVRCPLLFFPVTLSPINNSWTLCLREDVNISFNKSFLLAYSHFNQVKLQDDFLEKSFEDLNTDSRVFRTELYQLLKESPIELNFNQELFLDKLNGFTPFKKTDFEEQYQTGELILHSEAVLGIFPQAGSYLIPDYSTLIENEKTPDLEEFFYDRSGFHKSSLQENLPFVNKIKEEQTFTPFKLDASQEHAIKELKKGKSLLVQGPPGTGKSQLIANLICDYIARGKKVLLVCQKRVALDVVYDRLKEKEIFDFIALIHDFKNDRKALYEQINRQIEKLDEYKYRNNSLDAIQLERKFTQISRSIDQICEELEELKYFLFDESECGYSAKELYLSTNPESDKIDIKQYFSFFNRQKTEEFVSILNSYYPYAKKFNLENHLWNERKSFHNFSFSDKKKIEEILDLIPEFNNKTLEILNKITGHKISIKEYHWFLDREQTIRELLQLLINPEVYKSFLYLFDRNTNRDSFILYEKQIIDCFKNHGIEDSLPSEQLGEIQKAIHKAWEARKKPHKWIWWKLFSKDRYLLKRAFVSHKLDWDKKGFETLMQKIDNRLNLEHNITLLIESGWFEKLPDEISLKSFEAWFHIQDTAFAAKELLIELRNLKTYIHIPAFTYRELTENLKSIFDCLKTIEIAQTQWSIYLSNKQIEEIEKKPDHAIALKESLQKDFEDIVECDKILIGLNATQSEVLQKLLQTYPNASAEELKSIFLNSIQLSWLEQLENKHPQLRMVSSMKIEQLQKELQNLIVEKLNVSNEILLLKVRERTYKNIHYNRLNNQVTYRDLKHQVVKKKKIWPVRKTLSQFSEEIFDLVPCWMASPESVSALFPMQQLFDLVIFDEASQCFAEHALPALYRGRQILITGDQKQLKPNDLYQIRWEEDNTEDIPELEIDSLLELGSRYLPQVQLSGHYRSRSIELINFSNQHFYNNTLKMIPEKSIIENYKPPINYIKIDGRWNNGVNNEEANEVVKIIIENIQQRPEKTIGVVTFNYKQSELIRSVLEQKAITDQIEIPNNLFIKNIENVQGDERDIIIFSLAYAPNESGNMHMHFGSLNTSGGEHRLNVAITRAKELIYMVTSIYPNQLNVEKATNEGPVLLKEYLQYAYQVSSSKNTIPILAENHQKKELPSLTKKLSEILNDNTYSFDIDTSLPFSNISIKKENLYNTGILTDDSEYFQSTSAKEIYAYLPMTLRQKGWRNIRVHSREYWADKNHLKEKILKFAHHA